MATLHRHLAAVWFADIVGYTSLSEENEGEAVRLAHAFQRAVRRTAEGFDGRVVKSMGDGALAEFSSTEMAVRSAYALLSAFGRAAAEDGLPTGGLRVGVHVGDIAATEDGDLYGDGVNVASRLQSAAEPGEVWVSEDVWRQLRRRPELRFESRGEHELKGIGQPMQAHAVAVLDADEWIPPEPEAARAEIDRPGGLAAFLRRPLLVGGAALALVLAGSIAALVMRDRGGLVPADALAESAAPGVAVLPFSVNDPEFEAVYKEGGYQPAGIWAAQILAEQGDFDRAIRYMEQLDASPLIGLKLGELYEKADRREEALEAYGWVTLAWEDADPALQPRVAEARRAIARLEGLQRG